MNRRPPVVTPRRMLLVVCVLAVGLVVFVCLPLRPPSYTGGNAATRPSYEEAVAGWEGLIAATPANVRDDCRPVIFTHGRPTDQVVVLLHGLSNGPIQFVPFAKMLFERGHNVVIQRMPYHGEKDRLATDWQHLTAQEMLDSGNQAVDLARGLGRHVTVAGLSVNGAVTAWMAQNRSDIDRTVLMSPFLEPIGTPAWAAVPITRGLLTLPNFFLWWDPKVKENLPGPDYVYPRFPTRLIGQVMLLGSVVVRESELRPPASPSIMVISSEADIAISMVPVNALIANWEKSRPGCVTTYAFPKSENILHDFIDPHQIGARTDIVYPKLIELLNL